MLDLKRSENEQEIYLFKIENSKIRFTWTLMIHIKVICKRGVAFTHLIFMVLIIINFFFTLMQCDWYISTVIRPKDSQQNNFHPMQSANSFSLLKVYSQSALYKLYKRSQNLFVRWYAFHKTVGKKTYVGNIL